jgi:septal ring factor EnvC (AmiA/AmiB activator)
MKTRVHDSRGRTIGVLTGPRRKVAWEAMTRTRKATKSEKSMTRNGNGQIVLTKLVFVVLSILVMSGLAVAQFFASQGRAAQDREIAELKLDIRGLEASKEERIKQVATLEGQLKSGDDKGAYILNSIENRLTKIESQQQASAELLAEIKAALKTKTP